MLWLRSLAQKQEGQINFWAIFGGALLLVAYLAYPDPFHEFFQYLQHSLFKALHDSFGGNGGGNGGGGGGAGHGGGGADYVHGGGSGQSPKQ